MCSMKEAANFAASHVFEAIGINSEKPIKGLIIQNNPCLGK